MLQPKDIVWLNGSKDMNYIYAVYKRPTSELGTHGEWKQGMEKRYHMQMEVKAGVAIPISDKIEFKIKTLTRDKEGHYIMIKESIQKEDITILNICAPNIGTPQYIRQTLTDVKGEIDNNTIVGGFNTTLTPTDRSSKQN